MKERGKYAEVTMLGNSATTVIYCCQVWAFQRWNNNLNVLTTQLQRFFLELQARFGWHQRALGRCVLFLELVRNLLHCNELNTLVLHKVFNQSVRRLEQLSGCWIRKLTSHALTGGAACQRHLDEL